MTDDPRSKLQDLLNKRAEHPKTGVDQEIQDSTQQSDPLQDNFKELNSKVELLTSTLDIKTEELDKSRGEARMNLVNLGVAKDEITILNRKIDVLQKASIDKDAIIAELKQLLSDAPPAPIAEPEVPKPTGKIRRSKSYPLQGLKPGAGPAKGS